MVEIEPKGFGEWLQLKRQDRGLSREQAASEMGVSTTYIQELEEKEEVSISQSEVDHLALMLDIPRVQVLHAPGLQDIAETQGELSAPGSSQ